MRETSSVGSALLIHAVTLLEIIVTVALKPDLDALRRSISPLLAILHLDSVLLVEFGTFGDCSLLLDDDVTGFAALSSVCSVQVTLTLQLGSSICYLRRSYAGQWVGVVIQDDELDHFRFSAPL